MTSLANGKRPWATASSAHRSASSRLNPDGQKGRCQILALTPLAPIVPFPATPISTVGSVAARFPEPAQDFLPRRAEGGAQPADHVDAGVGRARLDALHVAPVDLGQPGHIVLRQSGLRSQAVDILAENGAWLRAHFRRVRRGTGLESGLIVAF